MQEGIHLMANGSNANIGFEKQIWDAVCVLFGEAYPRSRTPKRENAKIAAVGKCKPLHRQEDVSRGKYYD